MRLRGGCWCGRTRNRKRASYTGRAWRHFLFECLALRASHHLVVSFVIDLALGCSLLRSPEPFDRGLWIACQPTTPFGMKLSHKVHAASGSMTGSLLKPLQGLAVVAVRPEPGLKQVAGAGLRLNMALLCRHSIPAQRLRPTLADSQPLLIHKTEVYLGVRRPLSGRLSVPIEGAGIVLIHPDAVAVHPAEIDLCLAISLLCQSRKFIKRFAIILCVVELDSSCEVGAGRQRKEQHQGENKDGTKNRFSFCSERQE